MRIKSSNKRSLTLIPTAALLLSFLFAAAVVLSGCVGWDIDDLNRDLRVAATANSPISSIDSTGLRLLSVVAKRTESAAYVLGPGDVIKIAVYQLDTLGEERHLTLTVSEAGVVTLPLINRVDVRGLTGDALALEIRRRLACDYMYQPRVKVEVVEYRFSVAAVMGAVSRPGHFPVCGHAVTLLDLLGRAGGITGDADDEVHIIRGALRTDSKKSSDVKGGLLFTGPVKVRLSQLVRQRRGATVLVYPGDVVTVNRKGSARFYVSGHIAKPGSYPRPAEMTLLQALTVAGGLTKTADPNSLKIIRQLPQGGEELVEVNLTEIAAGRRRDVRIEAADLVVVPTTAGRRARAEMQRFFSRLFSVGLDARYNLIR